MVLMLTCNAESSKHFADLLGIPHIVSLFEIKAEDSFLQTPLKLGSISDANIYKRHCFRRGQCEETGPK